VGRCTAKPLAIDSKFFIVIPGRIHVSHVMVVLLGATAQDFCRCPRKEDWVIAIERVRMALAALAR
jgi:hypothetical protein